MKDIIDLREKDPKAYVREMKRYVEMMENGQKNDVPLSIQLRIIREDWRDPIIQRIVWGYIIEEKSSRDLVEYVPPEKSTIIRELQKRGLSRLHDKSVHLAKGHSIEVSNRLEEMLTGNLLGDAYLGSKSDYSASFSLSSIHRKYTKFLSEIYNSEGLNCVVRIKPSRRTVDDDGKVRNNKKSFIVTSKNYSELFKVREKWYPNGDKVIPKDIELTPLSCLLWFLDDGGNQGKQGGLMLHTEGFEKDDVDFLIDKLHELNFNCRKRKTSIEDQFIIYILRESKDDFLLYILPEFPKELEDTWGYKFKV